MNGDPLGGLDRTISFLLPYLDSFRKYLGCPLKALNPILSLTLGTDIPCMEHLTEVLHVTQGTGQSSLEKIFGRQSQGLLSMES